MEDIVQCVRCGTAVPRPANRRARCARCGTALPLFADDPSLPFPPMPPRGAPGAWLPPMPPPTGPDRFKETEILPEALPPPPGGYEDFTLDDDQPPAASLAGTPASEALDAAAAPRPRAAPAFAAGRRARSRTPLLVAAGVVAVLGVGGLVLRGGPAPVTVSEVSGPTATPTPTLTPTATATATATPTPTLTPTATATATATPTATRPAPAAPAPRAAAAAQRPLVATAAPLDLRASEADPPPPPAPAAPRPAGERPIPAEPPRAAAPPATEVPLPPPPRGTELVQDAPAYATSGFRTPRLVARGCVQESLRLPRDVADLVGEVATIRFAVGPDGAPSRFQLMAGPTDPRVAAAIWAAVQRCEFLPGTDGQGRPLLLWLVMPLRFAR